MKIFTQLKMAVFSLFVIGSCCNSTTLKAQELEVRQLTMEECIDIALENNINLQLARNNSLIADANKKQAILNYLPDLQARINYNLFTGTYFDTNIGAQVSTTTKSSGPNINSNLTIFNGMRTHQFRKQKDNEKLAADQNIEDAKQNVRANVIGFYLNVIAGQENIKISENRLDLLTQQLEREEKREKAGVGKIEEIYNLRSQVANEKLNLITLENTWKRDKLLLIQALQLNNIFNVEVVPVTVSDESLSQPLDPYQDVLARAGSYSPAVKSANYSLEASKNGIGIANANRYPVLSLYAEYGSNYSSNGAVNPESGTLDPDASLLDQLDFNKYSFFGLNMRIPIFTRGVTSNNVQIAKINVVNSELQVKQAIQDLNNAVQQAYLDLLTARSTYEAAKENLYALEQSFNFMEARYSSGQSDFYSYVESLNNKNRAELELINAKYSIALRQKILNILQGIE